jgi:hypothetical protein
MIIYPLSCQVVRLSVNTKLITLTTDNFAQLSGCQFDLFLETDNLTTTPPVRLSVSYPPLRGGIGLTDNHEQGTPSCQLSVVSYERLTTDNLPICPTGQEAIRAIPHPRFSLGDIGRGGFRTGENIYSQEKLRAPTQERLATFPALLPPGPYLDTPQAIKTPYKRFQA